MQGNVTVRHRLRHCSPAAESRGSAKWSRPFGRLSRASAPRECSHSSDDPIASAAARLAMTSHGYFRSRLAV
jgi:hypothetical protein